MDDYIDEDGTISIWKLMSGGCDPARPSDPTTRDLRWELAEHRLVQIQREATRNIEVLQAAKRARPNN